MRACKVTLAFVDNPAHPSLNKQFLHHDEPTDVLTFPYTDPGAKCSKARSSSATRWRRSTRATAATSDTWNCCSTSIHGCLHLCGYDDTDDNSAAKCGRKSGST